MPCLAEVPQPTEEPTPIMPSEPETPVVPDDPSPPEPDEAPDEDPNDVDGGPLELRALFADRRRPPGIALSQIARR